MREVIRKVCFICGKEFTTDRVTKKYCNYKCWDMAKKIKSTMPNFLIYERDNFQCVYCGKSSIEDGVKLHVDHVYPRSKDGGDEKYNLVTSCQVCNNQKGKFIMSNKNILRVWKIAHFRKLKTKKASYNELRQRLMKEIK